MPRPDGQRGPTSGRAPIAPQRRPAKMRIAEQTIKIVCRATCEGSDKEDAYVLFSEGARLESKGDTAGALVKYEAVMKEFPGTGAAKDAAVSIRNLTDK